MAIVVLKHALGADYLIAKFAKVFYLFILVLYAECFIACAAFYHLLELLAAFTEVVLTSESQVHILKFLAKTEPFTLV